MFYKKYINVKYKEFKNVFFNDYLSSFGQGHKQMRDI